jgi:hypothetical protein
VAARPPIDCFYVYPTVSGQPGGNANLQIEASETFVARAQASRFSSVCRVYAPMYRQLTLAAISGKSQGSPPSVALAYAGVLAAWKDYLAHDNDGRGVVVIGHSQGAGMLIRLLQQQVDGVPSVRRRLVSAVILGGNVTVPVGRTVGGSFAHIPACTRAAQTGCVIAYSSFAQAPPTHSLFGRPGTGVSALSGSRSLSGLQVLCVNPAALAGGAAPLVPYFLTTVGSGPAVSTPWVTYPRLYAAHCTTGGGASWLQVDHAADPGVRPVVTQTLGPLWGLHLADVNLGLGDLVRDVAREAAAYLAAGR